MKKKLKIVLASDTHGEHDKIEIPECDLFIYAGDYSSRGTIAQTNLFLTWLIKQKKK